MSGSPQLVWVVVVLVFVVLGLFAALALRRRFPVVWWLVFGWPALWWRIHRTWRDLAIECELSTSRRPNVALVGDVVVRGRALERVYPRLWVGLRPIKAGSGFGCTCCRAKPRRTTPP